MNVLLYHEHGLIDSLIRWQTRSIYSHAALATDEGTIIESVPGAGVRERERTDRDNTAADAFEVRGMGPADWAKAINFARKEIGCGYDYLGVARFISRREDSDNNRWFCSELVFAALHEAGFSVLQRIAAWAVSPGLLSLSPDLLPAEP